MFEGLRPECPSSSQNAYVTLATNADYALGALALVNSIKATGTGADCVVLHTAVPEDGLARLCDAGARLIAVDLHCAWANTCALKLAGVLHGAVLGQGVPTLAEMATSAVDVLSKNPNGYCGIGGTGVSCPIGIGVSA